jgi:hypothetical protein
LVCSLVCSVWFVLICPKELGEELDQELAGSLAQPKEALLRARSRGGPKDQVEPFKSVRT